MNGLIQLQEKFGALENFDQFANFLTSGALSPKELETLYDTINAQISEDN